MRKILSVVLSLSMLLTSFAVTLESAYAAESNTIEFMCGDNVTAFLDLDIGALTVKGEGAMNFFYDNTAPWWSYRKNITDITVEEGITEIAPVAFLDTKATKIKLPSTLEVIGTDALSMSPIEEIIIPEKNELHEFTLSSYLKNIPWYKNQPDGVVYLGGLLVSYKGTMPSQSTITIKDGTYAINSEAFYNQSNLVDIIVPDSVERIGARAFYGTSWYKSQEYFEPLYLGRVLYGYNIPWRATTSDDIKDELVIPDGIVSAASEAFEVLVYRKVVFPESFEYISDCMFGGALNLEEIIIPENGNLKEIANAAFNDCKNLKNFNLPASLKKIGINAFVGCDSFSEVFIPAGVEGIGITAYEPNSLDSFTVDKDNLYYCTDNNGILYNKTKTKVLGSYQKTDGVEELVIPDGVETIGIQAFVCSPVRRFVLPYTVKEIRFEAFAESSVETINIPYGVERINNYCFNLCSNLKETEIPKSVKFIETMAFNQCYSLEKAVITDSVNYIAQDAFKDCDLTVFYCYKDTTAYYYATENNYMYQFLEYPDMVRLETLLDEYNKLDRENYKPETLVNLDKAVSEVDMTETVITQEMVDGWVAAIENAKQSIEYLSADYTSVNAAIEKASLINRSLYTPESLAKLDAVVNSVNYDIGINEQTKVEAMAQTIENAVFALEYLPADYTKVNEAIAESEKLDRLLYSKATLEILDQSIAAVNYNLNITQQNIVDGFADRINNAISALEYAQVILRNELNGVIVSAAANVVYPTTALTVDMLDPSDYETANFAVGGYIKSVKYYDINLVRDGVKIQPDGTVSVKIRIPDGVKPEKCRVYHVTEDPVDPLVRFASTLEGNYIVFETDHFSEFAVIEVEQYLTGISITKMPSNLEYALNEKLDLSDMEVTALMSDGKTQIITDYDISNINTSSVGTKVVTVYYTFGEVTKSASFEITVSADSFAANITLDGKDTNEYIKKVKWYKGYSSESLQLECNIPEGENYSIRWSSDNEKVLVDKNGKVTNKGFFFPRKATITLTVTDSAGNVVATDSITVKFYKFSFQLSGIQSVFQSLKRNGILFF